MTYQLSFFCRAGEQTGQAALERLLDEVLSTGGPLPGEWLGPLDQEVAAFQLTTKAHSGQETPERLNLEIHVGVAFIAESVFQADEGCREYWQPESAAHILAADGEVDRIIAPLRAEAVARLFTDTPVDQQRLAWSNRHRPDARDAANWWLRLFLQIEHTIHRDADQRVPATHLYLDLGEQWNSH